METVHQQISELYSRSEFNQAQIIQLLTESGFSLEEIKPGVINYSKHEYRNEQQELVDCGSLPHR